MESEAGGAIEGTTLHSPAVSLPMILVPPMEVWMTGIVSSSSASKVE